MRRSVWLRPNMKKYFKERTNKDIRREEKMNVAEIKKTIDPEDVDVTFTPPYRMRTIWDFD